MASAYQLAMVSHGRDTAGALAAGLTREELATLGMAALIRQQIKLGEIGDVVRIGVAIGAVQPSSVGEDGAGQGGGSPLAEAFGRLPGAVGAPVAHLPGAADGEDGASAGDPADRPADQQSAGRLDRLDRLLERAPWSGPLLLDFDAVDVVDVVDAADVLDAAPSPSPTPTPPAGPARGEFHPHGPNFEILNREAVA